MITCLGCLLKNAQKCNNLVKELKRLSNYLTSYGQNRWRPIFLCIFGHFLCKWKSANWCTKMASDQKKSFNKMFLKFNFTAKYFWSRLNMRILHFSPSPNNHIHGGVGGWVIPINSASNILLNRKINSHL